MRLTFADYKYRENYSLPRIKVLSKSDYYPFGMLVPDNYYQDGSTLARFGFNGMERDDEIAGVGNNLNYPERNYDPRLARWLSIDGATVIYPEYSGYSYVMLNPINKKELDGDIVVDFVLDIGFIIYDIGEIGYDYFTTGKVNPISVGALGWDLAGLATPGGTCLGLTYRATAEVTEHVVVEVVEHVGKEALEKTGKEVLEEVGEKTVEATSKKVTTTTAKETTKETTKDAIVDKTKDVAKQSQKGKKSNVESTTSEKVSNKTEKSKTNKKKTYQTYTKTNSKTGQVYSGRTSGTGTPLENVARRDATHHKRTEDGWGKAQLDASFDKYMEARGREQILIDKHGGAQSTGGTSGNAINGISPKNPKKDAYIDAYNKTTKTKK